MREKKVKFKVGKDTLRGLLFIPSGKGPFPAVIFLHGSGGVGEMHFDNADKLSELGFLTFAFNYRGAGLSEGKFEEQSVADGIDDGEAAIKFFLKQKGVDKNRIGLSGGSFGGFIGALLSNKFPIKSLVLIAPAAYSECIFSTQRDERLPNSGRHKGFETSNSYREIKKFKGNLLVAVSEFDDVLPKGMGRRYFDVAKDALRKEIYLIKDAKHRISINPKAREDLFVKLSGWFSKTL